jgi:hypothetical protein
MNRACRSKLIVRYAFAWSATGLVMALAIGLSATAGASAVNAQKQSSHGCGDVRGTPWQVKGHGSGTSYGIELHGLPCSITVKWVPKLTHQPGGVGTTLKGPTGFRCIAVWASKLAAAGNCSRESRNFSWGPKVSH